MNRTIIQCKNCNRKAVIIEYGNNDLKTCPYCGYHADETESEICTSSPHPQIFRELDSFQLEAVFATEGAVRVIAGAGSGKTAVLTHRIALISNMMNCCSQSIFAITFTKKAANEMKERLARLMKNPAYVNTIHGMCADILKSEARRTPFTDFQIIDQNDKKAILGDIFEELGLDKSFSSQDELLVAFSKMKNKNPDYYMKILCMEKTEGLTEAANAETELISKALLLYLKHQRLLKFLDFDDMILLTLHIMKSYPEVLEKWQNIVRYMHVDEFQDISKNEFELIRLLSEKRGNLFVVGDPDQNIYTWRGSCLEYLNDFKRHFPVSRDFILCCNYRSVPAIINVSNELIGNNTQRVPKISIPVRDGMSCIKVHKASDNYNEIEYIVKEIKLKMNFSNSLKLSDFGILYRSSNEFRFIETVLRRNQLPYYAPCGMSFFDNKEIKDIHSYLRFMVCKDDVSFTRIINVPKRGIGKSKLELVNLP